MAYQPPSSTTGTRLASTSRAMPPPTPVIMPSRAAGTMSRPAFDALSAPITQNSASPAASRVRMRFSQRATAGCHRNVADAGQRGREQEPPVDQPGRRYVAEQDVADQAAAEPGRPGQDQASPNRSSRARTATRAPETAKTNVPARSRTSRDRAQVEGRHGQRSCRAVNVAGGSAIASWAATSWISRVPAASVASSTANTDAVVRSRAVAGEPVVVRCAR